jgi:A/G-specific adenine glycosylase
MDLVSFRRKLLRWYKRVARPLPWRETRNPWRILVSEIMLQQTRVEAVIGYYQRFLERFPNARALAQAEESDVLALWSGLGYYSRARNLRRAALDIGGRFPSDYDGLRALPGVGPYTAAAVASMAFGLPHAAVDGNVLRVVARLEGDAGDIGAPVTRKRFTAIAQEWLDPRRPGEFNQAMMELGATVCLPRKPLCTLCPVASGCAARRESRQLELPVKRRKSAPAQVQSTVVVMRSGNAVLLKRRSSTESRLADFWELPAPGDLPDGLPGREAFQTAGSFRHTIVNTRYTVAVLTARAPTRVPELTWVSDRELARIPLTTISRKALRLIPGFQRL